MTIYGGELQDYGTRKDGFFVNCTKCGWHSRVEVTPTWEPTIPGCVVKFECTHCGNTHVEES